MNNHNVYIISHTIDLEIRELLKVDDEDMKIILDAYPDTKILL